MRIEQTFTIAAPPEAVFDYVCEPANLADWQTSKTLVEPLTEGPPRLGTRVRERTKPRMGPEFEQVVEFNRFERPHEFGVHIVEGRVPVDGTWHFTPQGRGTRVEFTAEGPLPGPMKLLGPVFSAMMGREFAEYHEHLKANVEARTNAPA